MQAGQVDSRRAVEELKELAELTGGPDGARRVAWTDTWKQAREWLRGKLEEIDGLEIETDEAGNLWATAPGDSEKAVILGGHMDSVPQGRLARRLPQHHRRPRIPARPGSRATPGDAPARGLGR